MSDAAACLGFDVGSFSFGPTPVAILIVGVVLSIISLVVVAALSQVGGKFVDKRWPANEPLTPSEVLWAESGTHVAKHFPGLDPTIARDLNHYMKARKVAPGEVIVEAGDLATMFVMLTSGAAEQIDRAGVSSVVKPGTTFGADSILRRAPYDVMVRATAPSEIVLLDAQDYLAGVALGMSDGDDDFVVHALARYLTAPAPEGAGGFAAPSAPVPTGPRWSPATHRATVDLAGYILPEGAQPTRVLSTGTEVQVFESLPGWSHVRVEDGWVGWVSQQGLISCR